MKVHAIQTGFVRIKTAQVEGRGDELRLVIVEELAQHRHEAVDRVGGFSVGAGQPADRVIGPVRKGLHGEIF